jgi:hypothetical protein
LPPQSFQVDLDINAQVYADFPDCISQILKREFRIGACVAHKDAMTTAQHHFVQTQVIEVPSVRQ